MAVWYTLHFRDDLSYFWVHAFHKVPKFPRLICTGIEFHGLWLVDDKAGVLYSNLRHTLNKDLTVITPGFPGGTSGKEPACQCRRHKRCGFDPWVGKIPWRRAWQPTPGFLPGESHGQRSLAGYSPQGCKQQDMTEATYVITCNHPTKRSWWAFPQLRGDPVDSSHFEH